MRSIQNLSLVLAAVSSIAAFGCESGGVGDPCTPEDEYAATFAGYAVTEVNVESKSFQCETRVCLSAYFGGRVSCPYGGPAPASCSVPGTDTPITVDVKPQYVERRPKDAVYCSCRCDGPDKNVTYCECPDGYACQKLVADIGISGGGQLAGSYCVKKSSRVTDPTQLTGGAVCDPALNNCDD